MGGGGVCGESQHPGGPVTCQTQRASVGWGWGVCGSPGRANNIHKSSEAGKSRCILGLKEEWGGGEGREGSNQLNTPRTSQGPQWGGWVGLCRVFIVKRREIKPLTQNVTCRILS